MKIFSLFIFCFLIESCDPTRVIAIQNNSDEIIKLKAQTNNKFRSFNYDSIPVIYNKNNWIELEIMPNQSFDCGFAIGELSNDIPFDQIKLYFLKDTLEVNNKEDLVKLFNNRGVFNIMTPFILKIE